MTDITDLLDKCRQHYDEGIHNLDCGFLNDSERSLEEAKRYGKLAIESGAQDDFLRGYEGILVGLGSVYPHLHLSLDDFRDRKRRSELLTKTYNLCVDIAELLVKEDAAGEDVHGVKMPDFVLFPNDEQTYSVAAGTLPKFVDLLKGTRFSGLAETMSIDAALALAKTGDIESSLRYFDIFKQAYTNNRFRQMDLLVAKFSYEDLIGEYKKNNVSEDRYFDKRMDDHIGWMEF